MINSLLEAQLSTFPAPLSIVFHYLSLSNELTSEAIGDGATRLGVEDLEVMVDEESSRSSARKNREMRASLSSTAVKLR